MLNHLYLNKNFLVINRKENKQKNTLAKSSRFSLLCQLCFMIFQLYFNIHLTLKFTHAFSSCYQIFCCVPFTASFFASSIKSLLRSRWNHQNWNRQSWTKMSRWNYYSKKCYRQRVQRVALLLHLLSLHFSCFLKYFGQLPADLLRLEVVSQIPAYFGHLFINVDQTGPKHLTFPVVSARKTGRFSITVLQVFCSTLFTLNSYFLVLFHQMLSQVQMLPFPSVNLFLCFRIMLSVCSVLFKNIAIVAFNSVMSIT